MANKGKKGAKKPPVAIIVTIVVIILVIAIALVVIYFAAPNVWNKLTSAIMGNKDNNNQSSTRESTLVRGEGELQFHMLDVGQGDWLLVLLPDGKEMIIDAGCVSGSSTVYNTSKAYLDNYITDGQIDYLIATHSDTDHVVYMDEIIGTYDVDNIYMPALYATHSSVAEADIPAAKTKILDDSGIDKTKCYIETATYAKFYIAALTEPDCNIYLNLELDKDNNAATLDEHSIITASDNTYSITFFFENLDFYNNKKFAGDGHQINGISPTMILEYNGKRIVFTGDANQQNEPYMIQRLKDYYGGVIDCDVLKVAHHGSHEGSSENYLKEVKCEYAMVSCNKAGNTFKHPRQETLDRIKAENMALYRTDLHGTIVCVIDKDGKVTITPTNKDVSETDIWKGADAA